MPSAPTFQGGVFSDSLPGKRAGATLRVGFDAVEAETTAGHRFTLPFSQCELEQGGASGRMVFCHGPGRALTLYSEDRGLLPALSRAGGVQLSGQVERLTREARRSRSRTAQAYAVSLLVLLGLLYGGYLALEAGSERAVESLPLSIDEKLGALALESMPLQGERLSDPVLMGAVQTLVGRLSPHTGLPGMDFDVTVVDAPIVNAFALPGGTLVLYTGLLSAAQTPEQVAGVLAHEMAHATRRHGLKRAASSLGLVAAVNLALGDVSGLVALASELAQLGLLTRHGREQEAESDREAVRMMAAAGLPPAALADFFAVLQQEQGDAPEALAWLSSHPQLSQRMEDVRALAERQGSVTPRPLELDWAEVARHAKNPGVPGGARNKEEQNGR